MKRKTDHVEKNCKCVFCHSKCPKCGSTDVEVAFKMGFAYRNNVPDKIHLTRTDDEMELYCHKCETRVSGRHLKRLLSALTDSICVPDSLFRIEKGTVVKVDQRKKKGPPMVKA